MPPIRSATLRFDFDRVVTLRLYNFELEQKQKWEWHLAKMQAQMIATMTNCAHTEENIEEVDEGERCRGCGFTFFRAKSNDGG